LFLIAPKPDLKETELALQKESAECRPKLLERFAYPGHRQSQATPPDLTRDFPPVLEPSEVSRARTPGKRLRWGSQIV